MSISVFSMYGKYSWGILLKRLYSSSVFCVHAKTLLAYSETTLYIYKTVPKWQCLFVYLNSFDVFSDYD
jgi:hypothetical protein